MTKDVVIRTPIGPCSIIVEESDIISVLGDCPCATNSIDTQVAKEKKIFEAVNTLINAWQDNDTSLLNAWLATIAVAATDEGMEYCSAQRAAARFFEMLDSKVGVKAREIARANVDRYNARSKDRRR